MNDKTLQTFHRATVMLGVSIAASMLTVPLSVLGVPTVHRVVCSMIADIACIQVYIMYLVHAYHIGSHSAGLPHSHKHNFSALCVALHSILTLRMPLDC